METATLLLMAKGLEVVGQIINIKCRQNISDVIKFSFNRFIKVIIKGFIEIYQNTSYSSY